MTYNISIITISHVSEFDMGKVYVILKFLPSALINDSKKILCYSGNNCCFYSFRIRQERKSDPRYVQLLKVHVPSGIKIFNHITCLWYKSEPLCFLNSQVYPHDVASMYLY